MGNDTCLFCIYNIPVESGILPTVKKAFYKSVSRYCERHLKLAVQIMKEKVNKVPRRYRNSIPTLRNEKYLKELMIEEVCRLL